MLEVSRMHQSLKEPLQTLTVMVPTDIALQRFPQNQLRRILNDESLSKGTCEIERQYYIVNFRCRTARHSLLIYKLIYIMMQIKIFLNKFEYSIFEFIIYKP